MSTNYYCGKCDIYRSPGGSFYGRHEDLCPNCLRPLELVDQCHCGIEYPAIEAVEDRAGMTFHSRSCLDNYHESAWADSLEG